MINGNRGHGCNEHVPAGTCSFQVDPNPYKRNCEDTSLLISTKGARGIVAAIKYILPHRLLLNEGQKFTITYIDV